MDAGSFTQHLQPGERVVWAARAVEPWALRRLGIPPRSSLQLALHGLALTLGAAGVAVGIGGVGVAGWARVGLIVGSLSPALLLVGALLLPRRPTYAFTDGGRGLVRDGGRLLAFALSAEPEVRYDPNREAGALTFAEVEVTVLEGDRAGATERRTLSLRAVPYPHAALEVLSQLGPGAG